VSLNPAGGSVTIELSGGLTYTPGQTQRITVRILDPDTTRRYGFQLTARTEGLAQAGTFRPGANTTLTTQTPYVYINQTASASSYSFEWTPPETRELVRLYVAGMAARGTRDSRVYTAVVELRPAGATPPPALRAENPVVNGASYGAGISPGAWIAIFGENLAPAGVSRIWNPETEIVAGRLPTSLEGTSVTVAGRAAAIYFISPTQLNVQAPDADSTGTVEVRVTTPSGAVSATATLLRYAPGLFAFAPQRSRYVAAVHADGVLAAPEDLFGAGVRARPAKPGDIIQLYGTGFGPTNPPVPAGIVVPAPAELAEPAALRIRVGEIDAPVAWAGLVGAGLYQFNIQVPPLAAGDHLIVAEIAGERSQTGLYLTVVP
jgi:uncharacterized protein (TIGR03437 family)